MPVFFPFLGAVTTEFRCCVDFGDIELEVSCFFGVMDLDGVANNDESTGELDRKANCLATLDITGIHAVTGVLSKGTLEGSDDELLDFDFRGDLSRVEIFEADEAIGLEGSVALFVDAFVLLKTIGVI